MNGRIEPGSYGSDLRPNPMPTVPGEQACESTAVGGGGGAGDPQRSLPTPFLTKTYQLVEDHSVDELISWNDDGSTFIVWRPAEFARDLLPMYFKHNNFSSFVRQLNTYGFRKVAPDRWEFAHDCFRRGEKGLLRDIQRKKISAMGAATPAAAVVTVAAVAHAVSPTNSGDEQVISSNSCPNARAANAVIRTRSCTTTAPELLEENERLKKENSKLSHELIQLRGLCNKILSLMTNYASGQWDNNNNKVAEGQPLELFPANQNVAMLEEAAVSGGVQVATALTDISPRLFGVSIGVKRVRRDGEEVEEEEDMRTGNQQHCEENELVAEVKGEPFNGKSGNFDNQEEPGNEHDLTICGR